MTKRPTKTESRGPERPRVVSYLRVSTDRQGRNGYGVEAQRDAVEDLIRGSGWELIGDHHIEVESGGNDDRPQLAAALRDCRRHKAVLVIARLDRLGRSTAILERVRRERVRFIACDMPEANELTIDVLMAVAKHERQLISARTKAALAIVRQRGKKLGSPRPEKGARIGSPLGVAALRAKARQHAAMVKPAIEDAKAAGARTYREISDILNREGIPTPRGGDWYPMSVRNAIRRLEL